MITRESFWLERLSMKHTKKFTPFSKLSRHKRRDLYIQLRGRIQRTASEYGQNFTSNLILNEPDRPSFYNQWFDLYFLGLDGVTIWNTTLITANQAYWDAISDLAFEESYRLYPSNPSEYDIDTIFIPVYHPTTGKKLHYVMREPKKHPALNGMTRYQFVEEYSSKLIHEDMGNTAPIFESFHSDRTYRYGNGLHAVIDAPEINLHTIETMIATFRSLGERDWKSSTPVDCSRLPEESFAVMARKYQVET
jgi:hypothetical protein